MNNKERLLNKSNKELAEEIRHVFVENPASQYIDIEAWLESEKSDPIYDGESLFIDNKEFVVVGSDNIYGKEYIKVIDPQLSLVKYIEG